MDASVEELDLMFSSERKGSLHQHQEVCSLSNSPRRTEVEVYVQESRDGSSGDRECENTQLRNWVRAKRVNYDARDWNTISSIHGSDQPSCSPLPQLHHGL